MFFGYATAVRRSCPAAAFIALAALCPSLVMAQDHFQGHMIDRFSGVTASGSTHAQPALSPAPGPALPERLAPTSQRRANDTPVDRYRAQHASRVSATHQAFAQSVRNGVIGPSSCP